MSFFENGKLRFTDEDQLEFALARLTRLAKRGYHKDRYTFLTHEAKEILGELITEIKKNNGVNESKEHVNNTHSLVPGIWNALLTKE